MPLALSTGHQVGLAVVAAAFILFALASSFLFPRFRPQYPGGGLSAFIVVALLFFFGMLTAVEVFGAEKKEGGGGEEQAAATTLEGTTATTAPSASTQQQSTTNAQTTTTAAKTTTQAQIAKDVDVKETEFKISMPSKLAAGSYTFKVSNGGKLPHDLAVKGGGKSKLIQPGGSGELKLLLKPGKYTFFCSVPGHEQAGMKVDVTVS